jgi:hypothetical protein
MEEEGGGGGVFPTNFRKKKFTSIKFYENLSSGNRKTPCGWTDRHYKANSYY